MTQKISPAVFSSAARMASAMRRLSTSEIMVSPAARGAASSRSSTRPTRKLPDAPAPPNEPPPPEKPPPPGKPPDQDEPDDPHEPGIGIKIGPRAPRRGPAPVCAYPRSWLATLRTIMTKANKKHRKARTSRQRVVGTRRPLLGCDRHRLDDVVDPATDAASEIVGPKARNDGVLDDELRYRVGKRAFEAITDLDAHLAFVRRDDEQRAGILLFLSDLPVTPELVPVVLNRGSLKRLQRNHNELAGGLGLELGELALERGRGRRGENSGIVYHTGCQLREGERIGRKRT